MLLEWIKKEWKLHKKICLTCGNKCDNIKMKNKVGIRKEWCDQCAEDFLIRFIPKCRECMKRT